MDDPDQQTPAGHVLFVCIQNAGRSQMSRAFFERVAAGSELSARSAGTRPAAKVETTVVDVMAELGYDLSGREPQPLTRDLAEWADLVVTMGCGDACPVVPGTRYIDWNLTDPDGLSPHQVREVRDEIRRRIESLVAELKTAQQASAPEPQAGD
jgi:arsenate reductase